MCKCPSVSLARYAGPPLPCCDLWPPSCLLLDVQDVLTSTICCFFKTEFHSVALLISPVSLSLSLSLSLSSFLFSPCVFSVCIPLGFEPVCSRRECSGTEAKGEIDFHHQRSRSQKSLISDTDNSRYNGSEGTNKFCALLADCGIAKTTILH